MWEADELGAGFGDCVLYWVEMQRYTSTTLGTLILSSICCSSTRRFGTAFVVRAIHILLRSLRIL